MTVATQPLPPAEPPRRSGTHPAPAPTSSARRPVAHAPGSRRRWPAALPIAALVSVALVAFAGGYGYHRDELYFLVAGHHLAWAYPDQGVLTPLLARLMSDLAAGSLTVLRIPSALMAGATVFLTGALAGELGAGRRGQLVAAACTGGSVIVLFDGHLLSTSTFDLLAWTTVSWLAVRAVRTGRERLWPVIGLVVGLGLMNKPLIAFLVAGLVAGVAVCGPRRLLRSPWVLSAAVIALTLWAPWLIWQTAHGFPQLAVSRAIAAGGSVSSTPPWQVIPFQVLLVGPVIAPVWIAGLVRLVRDPEIRGLRFIAAAWIMLALAFTVLGGKPYYLSGLLPVLLGAGAQPVERWLERGRPRLRVGLLAAALVLSAIIGAVIALPVLPASDAGLAVGVNPDVGETIGWPAFARTVAAVRDRLPAAVRPVVFTANYGEAGAIDRYGPALGLPNAYSGHNAFGYWGAPPDHTVPVITIGLGPGTLAQRFRGCRVAAHVADVDGLGNQESGQPIDICQTPRQPWSQEWPMLRHLG